MFHFRTLDLLSGMIPFLALSGGLAIIKPLFARPPYQSDISERNDLANFCLVWMDECKRVRFTALNFSCSLAIPTLGHHASITADKMRVSVLTALVAAAINLAMVSADDFIVPRAGEALDVSGPITVAWAKPNKPSDEWTGLVNVTAMFYWVGKGQDRTWFYDVATNRPNDRAGGAEWDPHGIREFLKENGTDYAVAVVFSGGYDKTPPSEVRDGHREGRGWLTDEFEIKGYAAPDRSGAALPRAAWGAIALGILAHVLLNVDLTSS